MTQTYCFVKELHKYNVYVFDKNKAQVNCPNKDHISILIYRNMI